MFPVRCTRTDLGQFSQLSNETSWAYLLWRHKDARHWYCDVISSIVLRREQIGAKLTQMKIIHEYLLSPGIHSVAYKKMTVRLSLPPPAEI